MEKFIKVKSNTVDKIEPLMPNEKNTSSGPIQLKRVPSGQVKIAPLPDQRPAVAQKTEAEVRSERVKRMRVWDANEGLMDALMYRFKASDHESFLRFVDIWGVRPSVSRRIKQSLWVLGMVNIFIALILMRGLISEPLPKVGIFLQKVCLICEDKALVSKDLQLNGSEVQALNNQWLRVRWTVKNNSIREQTVGPVRVSLTDNKKHQVQVLLAAHQRVAGLSEQTIERLVQVPLKLDGLANYQVQPYYQTLKTMN